MCNCTYCNKEFENYRLVISHRRHCINNPNYEKNLELSKLAAKKSAITVKLKAESNPLNKINEYKFKCIKCGKEYSLLLKERDYLKGTYRKTCSISCANEHTGLTKGKTKICKCIKCGNNFEISVHRSLKNFICNDCKISKKQLYNTNRLCKLSNSIIKIDNDCCILTRNKCLDNCYFYKNGICNKNSLPKRLHTLTKYFNFDLCKCINEKCAIEEYNKLKEIILKDVDDGLSSVDICIKYTGSAKKGNTIFNTLKIKTRNLKEATKNTFLMGKGMSEIDGRFFKTEHHLTWNNKNVFLRSSYESDYANELDKNKINYDVENLRIQYFDTLKNEYRCAIPDFYLPDTNLIVEIKSIWTLDILLMKDKVKAYKDLGYDFKLILEHKETNLDDIIKIKNNKIIYKQ